MKIAVFSTKPYDRRFLELANAGLHRLAFIEPHLGVDTAILSGDAACVCAFVNDCLDQSVLQILSEREVRFVALRCAGFNNVDLEAARRLKIAIARVPAYSPHAVAEHTIALILALNRKLHRAYNRVREGNFSLDGLLGYDLYEKTVGIIGVGRIGAVLARILTGFGCRILAYDVYENPELRACGIEYAPLDRLLAESDIVSLHCPLTKENRRLINAKTLSQMKDGVMLINTSRGPLLDTLDVIEALKDGKVGALGLDVYEEEQNLFFEDLSDRVIRDDVFTRLLTFPNVLITGHQAFFTREALENIAATTIGNITEFEQTGSCANLVQPG